MSRFVTSAVDDLRSTLSDLSGAWAACPDTAESVLDTAENVLVAFALDHFYFEDYNQNNMDLCSKECEVARTTGQPHPINTTERARGPIATCQS